MQIPIGRRDDPHVRPLGFKAAHHRELAGLGHPQQPGLQVRRQLGDPVDEQRAGVRLREHPLPCRHCAREGPAHVPEQVTLDQALRDRGAVQGDVRVIAARPLAIQRVGHQLLAGAVLTLDAHVGVPRPRLVDDRLDLAHARGVAHDVRRVGPAHRSPRRRGPGRRREALKASEFVQAGEAFGEMLARRQGRHRSVDDLLEEVGGQTRGPGLSFVVQHAEELQVKGVIHGCSRCSCKRRRM
jgi:hypothetical protein